MRTKAAWIRDRHSKSQLQRIRRIVQSMAAPHTSSAKAPSPLKSFQDIKLFNTPQTSRSLSVLNYDAILRTFDLIDAFYAETPIPDLVFPSGRYRKGVSMYGFSRSATQNARFGPHLRERDERLREFVRSGAEADAAPRGATGRLWTDGPPAVHAERRPAAGAGIVAIGASETKQNAAGRRLRDDRQRAAGDEEAAEAAEPREEQPEFEEQTEQHQEVPHAVPAVLEVGSHDLSPDLLNHHHAS